MTNLSASRLLAAAGLLAMPLLAECYKYDFATAKGDAQEGFVRVSAENSAEIKWKSDAKAVTAHFAPVSPLKPGQGFASRYPITLTAGHLRGMYSAQFTLPKVAPGRYHVWAVCGLGQGPRGTVWDIRLQGGTGADTLTFQGLDEIMEMDFETEVGKDGMDVAISSRGHWILNGMVVVPQDEWHAMRDGWLKDLREEIFVLPKYIRKNWTYEPRPCTVPEPKWTEQQKKDGMAIYTRNWATPVWPDHFPLQKELDAPVRAFASLGEKEILNFAIYPLKGFENASVEVSDLVDGAGNRILSTSVDVRYVRYMYVRPNYSSMGVYYRAPDVLMPYRRPQRLVKGENFRVWLTVATPLRTAPGVYRGTATVKADGTAVVVPLTYRVIPVTLMQDESLTFGQYYYSPNRNLPYTDDAFSRQWLEACTDAQHRHLRESNHLNYNLDISLKNSNGRFIPYFDDFQQKIDVYRKYGLSRPIPCGFGVGTIYAKYIKTPMGSHISDVKMPPQAFFDDVTAVVAAIHKEAVRRQWPEILFYPVDEPSTMANSVAFMTKVLEAIKKVPGVRTYVTGEAANSQFEPMLPFVDVWCGQSYCFPREKILADMAARPGLEYWAYPNHISGENDHTPCLGARMTYGFGFWNSGYRCLIPWIYGSSSGSQWNYLDSKCMDFDCRVDQDGTTIPVTLWAAYMEGIDDGRYLNTLEKLEARARAEGFTAAADNARKTLDFVRNSIFVQTKYKFDDLWDPDAFDGYRWLLATQIMELNKLF